MNEKPKEGIRTIVALRVRRYKQLSREQKVTRFWRGALVFGIAFFLGRCELPFSVYPLGVAFLCAATDSLPYLSVGLIFSKTPLWLSLATVALTLLVRLLASVFDRFGEPSGTLPLYLRMTSSCVAVFFVSLIAIIGGGFRYYDLFGALLSITTAPIAVLLYSGFFPSDGTMNARLRAFTKGAAPVALSVSACFAFRDIFSVLFLPLLTGTIFYGYFRTPKPKVQAPPTEPVETDKLSRTLCALSELAASRGAEGFASEYAASATLLEEVRRAETARSVHDTAAEAALYERLCTKGFSPLAVSVLGTRGKRIRLSMPSPAPTAYLLEQAEKCLGICLCEREVREENGTVTLTFSEKTTVRAEAEFAFSAAEGVCGDAVCSFRDTENAKFYALVCDGMGAGKQAALTSRTAAAFLKKLLMAGASEPTALLMLGNFLRLGQNEEMTTTADLLVIDEYTGAGKFFKCGAAPSYVRHGDNVSTLTVCTVPLGILQDADVKELTYDFSGGDMAILTSDGVGDGESPAWLTEYLQSTTATPRETARHIVKAARENGSRDDLSTLVVTIKKHSA